MENQLSEDYFTRDFPYHKLEYLDEVKMNRINKELDKLKDITKLIDLSECCLTECFSHKFNDENNFYIHDFHTLGNKGCIITTAFYFLENEPIELNIRSSRGKGVKLKLPENAYTLNSIFTSPNEDIYRILKLSRSFDYIRDSMSNYSNHLEEILWRSDHINKYTNNPLNKPLDHNTIKFAISPDSFSVYSQIKNRDIFHSFGDKEIFIDNEKYVRCDIIRPFLINCRLSLLNTRKIYIEYIKVNIEYSYIPNIYWTNDDIFVHFFGDSYIFYTNIKHRLKYKIQT